MADEYKATGRSIIKPIGHTSAPVQGRDADQKGTSDKDKVKETKPY